MEAIHDFAGTFRQAGAGKASYPLNPLKNKVPALDPRPLVKSAGTFRQAGADKASCQLIFVEK
ncbi:hypothetical protein [Mariprofundus sp. NF]|uniref:hypothetical protein n=1 Tax=Mariprofundus sp. NF TaxID=2608716 RepID=UPI0015A0F4B4|nr:hypothetical protein [Mariprofundus sp. NF]